MENLAAPMAGRPVGTGLANPDDGDASIHDVQHEVRRLKRRVDLHGTILRRLIDVVDGKRRKP